MQFSQRVLTAQVQLLREQRRINECDGGIAIRSNSQKRNCLCCTDRTASRCLTWRTKTQRSTRTSGGSFARRLIAEKLPASITIIEIQLCADDIVRDAEWLHLYRQAGIERFLLGIEENTG